jgi:hypothetical protein
VRRPGVAAGRHYMQDDGPNNGSEDGCVTTGDWDYWRSVVWCLTENICYCFAVGQQLGHEKQRAVFESTVDRNHIYCNSDNIDLYGNTNTEF